MTAQVDALSVLRRVSRHVPNEEFVEFDDALHSVAELTEATASYAAARGVKPLHVVNARFLRVRVALARVGGA